MNDITLTINVSKIEAAKAGVDHFGDVAVTVTPSTLTEAARNILTSLLVKNKPIATGQMVYNLYTQNGASYDILPVPVTPTAETVAQWLEACAVSCAQQHEQHKQVKAEEEKREIEQTAAWCEKPIEEIIRQQAYGVWETTSPYSFAQSLKTKASARLAEAQKVCDARNAERAARAAEVEAAKDAVAKRRADQIAAWIATAPESMRKRHARGLLPEEDIISEIRNQAYAPLDHLPRYERMSDDDVRSALSAEDDDQGVDYTTREAESAHDDDIALMEQIEALLPSAKCTLLEHAGWLTDAAGGDDPEVTRYAVKVAIKVGELAFSREYAA